MFKEGYRDTSLDRGTGLYWRGGGGGYRTVQWVQACTGVKACTCREGYRGTSLDRGKQACTGVGGGGGGVGGTGLYKGIGLYRGAGLYKGNGVYREG